MRRRLLILNRILRGVSRSYAFMTRALLMYPHRAAIAIGFGFLVMFGAIDAELSQLLREADRRFIAFFKFFANSGNSQWYLIPLALVAPCLYCIYRFLAHIRFASLYRWATEFTLFVFVVIACSGIVTNILKVLSGRARPKLLDGWETYGFFPASLSPDFHSFPSGHSNTLFALACALALFSPRSRLVLLILAGFLASSRIVVNAHFVSDVIAGAGLAFITTLWLRDVCARRGFVFCIDRHGNRRLKPQGRFVRQRLGTYLRGIAAPFQRMFRAAAAHRASSRRVSSIS